MVVGPSSLGLRERFCVKHTPTPAELRKQMLLTVAPYLVLVAVLAGCAALASWAYHHPAWTVEHVEIRGDNRHQSDISVQRAIKPMLNESFLSIDLSELQRLVEDVPWVRQAAVQRDFPKGLRITIEEHRPVAWWGEAKGTLLVNAQGEIFEAQAEAEESQNWPVLAGPDEHVQDVLKAFNDLQASLRSANLSAKRLMLSPHGSWTAVLDGDIELALGRAQANDWLTQVNRMINTLPDLRQRYEQALRSIDLRYPNGYAVALAGVSVGPRNNP